MMINKRLINTVEESKRYIAGHLSYLSSKTVKKVLRDRIYEKLLQLGAGYTGKVSTASVVQVAVEGVEQLETYFGAYLPQFFYSMIAPVTLFLIISPISLASGTVLLLCIPLIAGAIMIVQKTARKIFSGYWSQYTSLGDSFLENIQGLTTLKIYRADGVYSRLWNTQQKLEDLEKGVDSCE